MVALVCEEVCYMSESLVSADHAWQIKSTPSRRKKKLFLIWRAISSAFSADAPWRTMSVRHDRHRFPASYYNK